jgi:hypothetical protein
MRIELLRTAGAKLATAARHALYHLDVRAGSFVVLALAAQVHPAVIAAVRALLVVGTSGCGVEGIT